MAGRGVFAPTGNIGSRVAGQMTIDERMERLTGIVETLAGSVVAMDNQIEAHDRQIEALITLAEKHDQALKEMSRQWQAYINTLPRH